MDAEKKQAALDFGKRIRDVLAKKGMSAATLGRAMGMAHSQVSNVLTGRFCPTLVTIRRFAEALGVSPAELVTPSSDGGTTAATTKVDAAPLERAAFSDLVDQVARELAARDPAWLNAMLSSMAKQQAGPQRGRADNEGTIMPACHVPAVQPPRKPHSPRENRVTA